MVKNYYSIGKNLFYGLNSSLGRPSKPRTATFIVTRKCNSKCIMCNIWQEGSSKDNMPLDQINDMFKKKFFSNLETVVLSGGEAFLRKDIVEIIKIIQTNCKNLKNITVASNGLLSKVISDQTRDILLALEKNKTFSIQISLDGVGEKHNLIRGIPTAFNKVTELIQKLKLIKKENENFQFNLAFLTMPSNVNEMKKVDEFIKSNNIGMIFSNLIISKEYYNNDNSKLDTFSKSELNTIKKFYIKKIEEKDHNAPYYKMVLDMYNGNKRDIGCLFTYSDIFIEYNGKVHACMNAEQIEFGNILNKDFETNWFSKKSNEKRKLLKEKYCINCKANCGFNVFESIIKYRKITD